MDEESEGSLREVKVSTILGLETRQHELFMSQDYKEAGELQPEINRLRSDIQMLKLDIWNNERVYLKSAVNQKYAGELEVTLDTATRGCYSSKMVDEQEQHSTHKQNEDAQEMFGVTLDEIMEFQQGVPGLDDKLPRELTYLVERIIKLGGLEIEGIFRIPGNDKTMDFVKKQFRKGIYDAYDGEATVIPNVHVLCSLLKQWLGELSDGLFTEACFLELLKISKTTNPEDAQKLNQLIRTLPKINKDVINYLVKFLRDVSCHKATKMDLKNIAKVFAPNLIPHKYNDTSKLETLFEMTAEMIKVLCFTLEKLDIGDAESNDMEQHFDEKYDSSRNEDMPPVEHNKHRVGQSDADETEYDLEAEESVPLPNGDVHKKKRDSIYGAESENMLLMKMKNCQDAIRAAEESGDLNQAKALEHDKAQLEIELTQEQHFDEKYDNSSNEDVPPLEHNKHKYTDLDDLSTLSKTVEIKSCDEFLDLCDNQGDEANFKLKIKNHFSSKVFKEYMEMKCDHNVRQLNDSELSVFLQKIDRCDRSELWEFLEVQSEILNQIKQLWCHEPKVIHGFMSEETEKQWEDNLHLTGEFFIRFRSSAPGLAIVLFSNGKIERNTIGFEGGILTFDVESADGMVKTKKYNSLEDLVMDYSKIKHIYASNGKYYRKERVFLKRKKRTQITST